MEQVKITDINHYLQEDFDELNIRIDNVKPASTFAEIADDAHNFFLQIDAESQEVVGATILYADDWFKRIGEAFQRGDVDDPEVRFFLEQKIQLYSRERMPPHPEPTPGH